MAAIDASRSLGLFGFFTSAVTELAISSTTGVDAYQQLTDATTLVVAASEDASGYASQTSWSADGIDAAAVGREAVEKAERTRNAQTIEPAPYRAVLEPYAFADLVGYFSYDAFGANGLLEERSYLAGRLGERIVDEKVTIVDDALDPRGLPKRFDFEGAPKQRVPLIENGVAKGVVWDRTTAARAQDGRASTGHAPPAGLPPVRPADVRARRRGRRGRVARAALRARRRRHLHHAPPLPRDRRSPRGRDHRDDARRHVPHPRREGRGAAREPPLHRVGAADARGRARA